MRTILNEIKSGMVIFNEHFTKIIFANKQAKATLCDPSTTPLS